MLLDIILGVLVAKLSAAYFSVTINPAIVLGGILFSILPDIDLLKLFFRKQKRSGNEDYAHRDLFHYPIPYVLVGTSFVLLVGGSVWGTMFFFSSLLHFIHDSIGIGWGVKWLYPFSKKSFAFLYHYEVSRRRLPKKLVYAWSPAEIKNLSQEGDKDWIKNIYFKLHPYSIGEHILTIILIILLFC